MVSDLSDNDSISTADTLLSQPQEEYELETILAQRSRDGSTQYLAKWVGYPEEECTWEPAGNFDPETLEEWQSIAARIQRGDQEPFDVHAWQERSMQVKREAEERRARRARKRARLDKKRKRIERKQKLAKLAGFVVSDASEDDSQSSDGRSQSDKRPKFDQDRQSKPQSEPRQSAVGVASYQGTSQTGGSQRAIPPTSTKNNTVKQSTANFRQAGTRPAAAASSGVYSLKSAKKSSTKLSAAGSGPSRSTGSVLTNNWDVQPKPRKSTRGGDLDPLRAPQPGDSNYKKLSTQYKHLKGTRNEKAPDANTLVMFDPRTGPAIGKEKDIGKVAPNRAYYAGVEPQRPSPLELLKQQSKQQQTLTPVEDSTTVNARGDNEALFVDQVLESPKGSDTEMIDAPFTAPQLNDTYEEYGAAPQLSNTQAADSRTTGFTAWRTPLRTTSSSSVSTLPNKQESAFTSRRMSLSAMTSVGAGDGPPKGRSLSLPKQAVARERHSDSVAEAVHDTKYGRVFPMHFRNIKGDLGSDQNMTDIYGDLVMGQYKETKARTVFKGLGKNVKELFLTIKRPPKECHVWIQSLVTPSEWFRDYHMVRGPRCCNMLMLI
jgi:hypothetical protein